MLLYNFHTHYPENEGERVILQGRDCWGIHPAEVTETLLTIEPPTGILAIGECGLDRLAETPYDLQMRAFRLQIEYSEKKGMPLIIHCVKAFDDLLRIHHEYHPLQAWIFHGFRGKLQQMRTLLERGFFISFGFRFNEECLIKCPPERLLIETDADLRPVCMLYDDIAQRRQTSIEILKKQMEINFTSLFSVL